MSRPPDRSRTPGRVSQGFTLLELLVVIAIAGILFGFAVLAVPKLTGTDLERDARTLEAALLKAHNQAMFSGDLIGVRITPAGYAIHRFEAGAWQPVDAPVTLHPEHRLVLPQQPPAPSAPPQLLFFPNGVFSGPQRLVLAARPVDGDPTTGRSTAVTLTIDALGRIRSGSAPSAAVPAR